MDQKLIDALNLLYSSMPQLFGMEGRKVYAEACIKPGTGGELTEAQHLALAEMSARGIAARSTTEPHILQALRHLREHVPEFVSDAGLAYDNARLKVQRDGEAQLQAAYQERQQSALRATHGGGGGLTTTAMPTV